MKHLAESNAHLGSNDTQTYQQRDSPLLCKEYSKNTLSSIPNGKKLKTFPPRPGAKQGCLSSPQYFSRFWKLKPHNKDNKGKGDKKGTKFSCSPKN